MKSEGEAKSSQSVLEGIAGRFGPESVKTQQTIDRIPTIWVSPANLRPVLRYLKADVDKPFRMLYDLTAIDERVRALEAGQPEATSRWSTISSLTAATPISG